jgi:choline dehydrogenase-like flavoprotein
MRISVQIEDLPNPANRVTLSSQRDSFGLPRNEITFQKPSDYDRRAVRALLDDLPERLAPLGVRDLRFNESTLGGGHLTGTVRMGSGDDGVVGSDFRHRRRDNLFVVGGAVFPTFTAAHPTLTIAALATRLGRALAAERG